MTKFIALKGLKSKPVEEVTYTLLGIFTVLGVLELCSPTMVENFPTKLLKT